MLQLGRSYSAKIRKKSQCFFVMVVALCYVYCVKCLVWICIKGSHLYRFLLYGDMGKNLYTIPFHEFHFHLVPLIPYSAILKKILVRSLIYFFIFSRVENQHLKQQLKQELRILFKIFRNLFLCYRKIFCVFNKIT